MFRDPRNPINDRPIIDDGLDDDIGGGGGGGTCRLRAKGW